MKQVQGTSLLVTIAEDMPHEPVLKVWALDKLEKKTGIPRCVSTLSINNGRKPFPVSLARRVCLIQAKWNRYPLLPPSRTYRS
jgi:hypothetical protein